MSALPLSAIGLSRQNHPLASKRIFAALAALALLVSGGMVQAGPAADKAAESERLLAAGKALQAWQVMDEATLAIWEKLPLTIAKALFVVGDPQGYGIYNPRESSVFKPGDTLVVYVEPVGFGHAYANGVYTIALRADLVLKDKASGRILFKREGFGDFRLNSRKPNREFFLKLSIDLNNAPEGDFLLTIPIIDKVKGQKAEFTLPFSVRK